jgi:CubicO group peptidase (beta-lactamase class C family)
LLLGICIDRGLIESLDDSAEKYEPAFAGTELGGCTLRNLSNMSSGVEVTHERDNPTIYPCAFWGPGSDIRRVVAGWNLRREPQGQTFNYTGASVKQLLFWFIITNINIVNMTIDSSTNNKF